MAATCLTPMTLRFILVKGRERHREVIRCVDIAVLHEPQSATASLLRPKMSSRKWASTSCTKCLISSQKITGAGPAPSHCGGPPHGSQGLFYVSRSVTRQRPYPGVEARSSASKYKLNAAPDRAARNRCLTPACSHTEDAGVVRIRRGQRAKPRDFSSRVIRMLFYLIRCNTRKSNQ